MDVSIISGDRVIAKKWQDFENINCHVYKLLVNSAVLVPESITLPSEFGTRICVSYRNLTTLDGKPVISGELELVAEVLRLKNQHNSIEVIAKRAGTTCRKVKKIISQERRR